MLTIRQNSILGFSMLLTAGCTAQRADVTANAGATITSVPSGAFVMYARPTMYFDEKDAVVLGKTPLLRNLPPDAAGAQIQITKTGYREWTDTLSSTTGEITAVLQPLTDQEKVERGWVASSPASTLTVAPVRVGLHQVGNAAFESTPEAAQFRSRVVQLLSGALEKRFPGKTAVVDASAKGSDGVAWGALEGQISKVRLEKLGSYPVPMRLEIPAEIASAFADADSAVLLLRAEAYYLSSGQRVARAAVPILLSLASGAAAGVASQATGATVMYPVFGAGPNQETVLLQMFLVHAQTHELLWYGQVSTQQYFSDDGVVESLTARAAEQVPSAYFAGRTL